MSLNDDYKQCKKIIKQNSKTFYKAFSMLNTEKSNAIYAVYSYCRITDDSIDIHKSPKKLKIIKIKLDDFKVGKTPDEPLWRALKDVFNKYNMKLKPFYEMIQGQEMDIQFKQPQTQEDLMKYCYYVAGTVGNMIIPIIASKNSENPKLKNIKLGEAMQITNILRDIYEDLQNGRIYIPKEIMKKFKYTEEELKNKIIDERFINMWEYEAKIAQKMYDQFYEMIDYFDKDSQKPLITSAKLYNKILNNIRKNNYEIIKTNNGGKK
ncbi:squalene/phytoene synthase family protein [Oceanotoga sp. DSM 15011]|uniref:phytoene/squalene synthase family protein n=1 Tax=Oceanotoga sp. DSM 15011 TaxID=2984951 RepID=UPI0021F3DC15|nr:phytoene/squalene synthase family protein [Oceanotoga sp. DSM 15011]UYO99133.1 squalene/phytoene synthase family protein [Oceanotoga sp. DSM 15011]